MGTPNFERFTGVFTPLYFVALEVSDTPLEPMQPVRVRGETYLAKTLAADGTVNHLIREGRHSVLVPGASAAEVMVASARLTNVFTRYDSDPVRRRVTTLPEAMGLGELPSRVGELPALETIVPSGRRPDFAEADTSVWHYGQTDANRHVNGMEYLRMMECYVADVLHRAGHDLRRLYFAGARIIYRKPCFRGEGYRRTAWFRGEAPLTISGAFYKDGDGNDARPAVAIELTVSQHESGQ